MPVKTDAQGEVSELSRSIGAKATVVAQFTADARGSQAVLLAFVIVAPIILIVGAAMAAFAPSTGFMPWVFVGLGAFMLGSAVLMWLRSQPTTDRSLGPAPQAGSITLRRGQDEVTIVGNAEQIHSIHDYRQAALTLMSRRVNRRPLPKAAGKVAGKPSDVKALVPFSESEAEADYAAVQIVVDESQRVEAQAIELISSIVRNERTQPHQQIPTSVLATDIIETPPLPEKD